MSKILVNTSEREWTLEGDTVVVGKDFVKVISGSNVSGIFRRDQFEDATARDDGDRFNVKMEG